MKITLVVDSSQKFLQLGLMVGEKKYFSISNEPYQHANNIVTNIHTLCKKNNIKLLKINQLGFNIGPGSFTGMRIGLAAVATIATILKLPIYCLNSFEIMLSQIHDSYDINKSVLMLIKANKYHFYMAEAIYKNSQWLLNSKPKVIELDLLAEYSSYDQVLGDVNNNHDPVDFLLSIDYLMEKTRLSFESRAKPFNEIQLLYLQEIYS